MNCFVSPHIGRRSEVHYFRKTCSTFAINKHVINARPSLKKRHSKKVIALSTSEPLLRPASTERWDSGTLTSPVVRYNEASSDGPWFMWYSGRPRDWDNAEKAPPGTLGGFIGMARSADGINWERINGPAEKQSILNPNSSDWWWFDTVHLSAGDVLLTRNVKVKSEDSVYFMYYSGGDYEQVEIQQGSASSTTVPLRLRGARTRIGVALSKDGKHFTRLEGEHPSGCILDTGKPGHFDEIGVQGPRVTQLSPSQYIMHYFAYDANRNLFVIGRASSKDGLVFNRDDRGPVLPLSGQDFDRRGHSRCSIVKRTGNSLQEKFFMYLECISSAGVHTIALTTSNDCRNWDLPSIVLNVSSSQNSWDAAGVSHPCAVVLPNGSLRLYYVGKSHEHSIAEGQGTCIGLAESDGEDWSVLRRVRISQ